MLQFRSSAAAAVLLLCLVACSDDASAPVMPAPEFAADIRYTRFGVPHIKADNFAGLGFGVAHAYLKENFCLLAEHVVTVNGERSKFFGPAGTPGVFGPAGQAFVGLGFVPNLDADIYYKAYIDENAWQAALAQAPLETRELVRGYIAGYNDFLETTGAANLPEACRAEPWVRPIELRDLLRMFADNTLRLSGAVFARAIASAAPPSAMTTATTANFKRNMHKVPRYSREAVLEQLNPAALRPKASNGYAIGKDNTGTGSGMLLANPHFPWSGTLRFFQVQMTVPGHYDAAGVMLGFVPAVLIGFNQDVAWTLTTSTGLRHTLTELKLAPDSATAYIVDGQRREMTKKTVSVEVRNADGSVTPQTRTLYASHLGPIVSLPATAAGGIDLTWSATTAYTMRDANRDNTRGLDQLLHMGRTKNVAELKQSLDDVAGLPFLNTLAADRNGQVLFSESGPVPHLTSDQLKPVSAGGCVGRTVRGLSAAILTQVPVLDGSRSACEWVAVAGARQAGILPAAQLPSLTNSDHVANSNQSHWTPHLTQRLEGFSPILGAERAPIGLRPQLAFDKLQRRFDGTDGISASKGFDSLQTMEKVFFENRLLAAERVVAPLLDSDIRGVVTLPNGTMVDLTPARELLAAWDRKADLASGGGAVLFREFWRAVATAAAQDPVFAASLWSVPFDPALPLTTPNMLNVQNAMVAEKLAVTLGATYLKLTAAPPAGLGLDLSKPLGQLQFLQIGPPATGRRIGLHGGEEHEGPFNKLTLVPPVAGLGYPAVIQGSSFVAAVTWIDGAVTARTLLTYAQSTNPASPHFTDQTEQLFAPKQFISLPFTDAQIQADPQYRLVRVSR